VNYYPAISGYEYIQFLGSGNFYCIYEACHLLTGTRVCLKVTTDSGDFTENVRATWRHEAQILAALDHPNIVWLVEVREASEAGVFFNATEYVKGDCHAGMIHRRGPVPFAEVIRIASRVAAALDHAHSRNVIHANLYPGHILLGEAGEVVLKGFGAHYPIRIEGGIVLGRVQYLAPEQLTDVAKPVPQTDIYSLAEVVFYLLTGTRRFHDKDGRELLQSKQLHKVTGVRGPRQTLPGSTALVLERALAFRPEDRYESASQFVTALELASHQKSPKWWNVWR
jgi:serine/threonine protein kinase